MRPRYFMGIDPGTEQSAWVKFAGGEIASFGIDENETVVAKITGYGGQYVFCEDIEPRRAGAGQVIGRETIQTIRWTGHFQRAWYATNPETFMFIRTQVMRAHITGKGNGKDPDVRFHIIEAYGGKERAIGKKKQPGPLHGITSHVWSALAIALTGAHLVETSHNAGQGGLINRPVGAPVLSSRHIGDQIG